MKLLSLSRSLASICLVLSLGYVAPVVAESKDVAPSTVESSDVLPDAAKTGALSLTRDVKGVDEPFYAGTSTWFLLSIALLGSIAVQRRTDVTD